MSDATETKPEKPEMTRHQQTWIICGVIAVAAIGLWFMLAPEKDLSHLTPYERCDYRQEYKKFGGKEECRAEAGAAAARRLLGY